MRRFFTLTYASSALVAWANPSDLIFTAFSGSDLTPSPTCLTASADGHVFVGVDLLGSLGKGAGKGSIVRLTDTDLDGQADQHSVFAKIDNPRGLISCGDKLFVLHTLIPESTGILTGMNLSVLEDRDHDGIADGPPRTLIKDISVAEQNRNRGADHTTNGIRMGIDGWIYIAVGDFGFVDATGTDEKKLTQLGGGILRVRPDGTQMEVYNHGNRNIYDVAIDPYLNIFTRDNTNDGGGWNIRFHHQLQSAENGYPLLFKNFTREIIPALGDLGGGSGTGALFIDEPTWPERYNRVPMMCDWGRNEIYIHRLTVDGPSFTQKVEDFVTFPQPVDLDVDGSGRLYVAAWDGAGYKGSPDKGFVQRIVPQSWKYRPFPSLTSLSAEVLVKGLATTSATARLATQQEILKRDTKSLAPSILAIASDSRASLAARVAAVFTYKQLLGRAANLALVRLAEEPSIREFALRALTDRLDQLEDVPLDPFYQGLRDVDPRVRAVSAVSLGRLGKIEAAEMLLAAAIPPHLEEISKPLEETEMPEGPHATPNSPIIIPHLAVQALVRLHAAGASLKAVAGPSSEGALWALRLMCDPESVDGLIRQYRETNDIVLKNEILATLARLYTRETPYDGTHWWNTRPDTHGPYYIPEKWLKSPEIETFFRTVWATADSDAKARLTRLANKNRMNLPDIGEVAQIPTKKLPTIGETSIENVMLALDKLPGNSGKGGQMIKTQACIGCHGIAAGDRDLGPDLKHIGAHLDREAIAEAILKPDASIAASWVEATTTDGTVVQGTLVEKSDAQLTIRNIAGTVTTLKKSDVKQVKTSASTIMGPRLLDLLSMEQFADVVAYLHSLK
jgi:putative heme-binding domain-containing protein